MSVDQNEPDVTRDAGPTQIESLPGIGPYHALQKLGERGMGEVWIAEQKQPVRRKQ